MNEFLWTVSMIFFIQVFEFNDILYFDGTYPIFIQILSKVWIYAFYLLYCLHHSAYLKLLKQFLQWLQIESSILRELIYWSKAHRFSLPCSVGIKMIFMVNVLECLHFFYNNLSAFVKILIIKLRNENKKSVCWSSDPSKTTYKAKSA